MVSLGFGAAVENAGELFPPRPRQIGSIDDLAFDGFDAVGGANAERGRDLGGGSLDAAGAVRPGHKMVPTEAGLADHILEGNVSGACHRGIERAACIAIGISCRLEQHLEIRALHHLVLVAFVHHNEPRRYIGLERKLLQQARAECVDGLHFESARSLQRASEQLSGRHPQPRVRTRDPGVHDCRVERRVIERDPMSQR